MRQPIIILSGFLTGLVLAIGILWYQGEGFSAAELSVTTPQNINSDIGISLSAISTSRPVAVDSVNTKVDELYQLLTEARQRSENHSASPVPFVLHGEEIRYFTRQQFDQHRELVELAAELDANMVVEVRACRTTMQMMGIQESDLPGFVELVPFGPDEVERLGNEGYEIYTPF